MENYQLGELEEIVLLAVGSLYEDGYALNILNVIKENSTRILDVTTVHSVLRRLEKKGFVESRMGGATKERGGRRKRFFTLTQVGRAVLDQNMEVRANLYNKLPRLTFQSF